MVTTPETMAKAAVPAAPAPKTAVATHAPTGAAVAGSARTMPTSAVVIINNLRKVPSLFSPPQQREALFRFPGPKTGHDADQQ